MEGNLPGGPPARRRRGAGVEGARALRTPVARVCQGPDQRHLRLGVQQHKARPPGEVRRVLHADGCRAIARRNTAAGSHALGREQRARLLVLRTAHVRRAPDGEGQEGEARTRQGPDIPLQDQAAGAQLGPGGPVRGPVADLRLDPQRALPGALAQRCRPVRRAIRRPRRGFVPRAVGSAPGFRVH